MASGEWRVASGFSGVLSIEWEEWQQWRAPYRDRASGEWRVASGEWQVASGKWQVASGEWRVASGEWRVANDFFFGFLFPHS